MPELQQDNSPEAILHRYIHVLELVISYEATIRYFPAMFYPISLLADEKLKIAQAINQLKEVAFLNSDYRLVQLLDWALDLLDGFVEDYESDYLNEVAKTGRLH